MSGYGLAVSYISKGDGYLKTFPRKRGRSLLPAFIIMTVAAILWNHYVDGKSYEVIWEKWEAGYPPLATSWYIYALIFYYVAFYVIARLTKSVKKTAAGLIAVTLTYMVTLHMIHYGGFWYSSIMAANVGFLIAIYDNTVKGILLKYPRLSVLSVATLLVVASVAAAWRRELFQPALTSVLPLSVWIIYVTVRMRKCSFLDFTGRISYEIYLSQGFMIVAVASLSAGTAMPVLYAGSIAIGWILWKLIAVKKKGKIVEK